MQGEKSKLNLCETRANFIYSQNFDSAMVRKCSFYDFYDLEEDDDVICIDDDDDDEDVVELVQAPPARPPSRKRK